MPDPTQPAIDRLLAAAPAAITPRARPDHLPQVIARGGLIIDTRPHELRTRDGHMPHALIVDRNVLEWRLDPTSPHRLRHITGPDQPVVLFCDEGYASSLAAATLRQLGLHQATDLIGGYQAWLRHTAQNPDHAPHPPSTPNHDVARPADPRRPAG